MKTLVGIFTSQLHAATAYKKLRSLGISGGDLIVLAPGASQQQINDVPTEEGEQPGMGKVIGAVIGGAVGLAAGAAVATLLLPGLGPVITIGLTAGAFRTRWRCSRRRSWRRA